MGGDKMPRAAILGALKAASEGIAITLVGHEDSLKHELAHHNTSNLALDIHHADDLIDMNEQASDVRKRKDTSIMRAMQLVKDGQAAACVSMGHSGATMAAALMVLGRIKGIERPAILANIPTKDGYAALIDAGANADCRASYLQQFALMGSVYAKAFYQTDNPKVGLMSIGEEETKGNELVKEAHLLLKETAGLNFYGNVEGRDLFEGLTDVVVTDGFTGNVVLKLAEGEAKALFSWIRETLRTNGPLVQLGAALVRPALRKLATRMDPSEYGAQPLLGVNGYAFIGHGSADERAVYNALKTAKRSIEAKLNDKIAAVIR